ncbi:MAG: thioredoxin family protein, partial [Methanomicrobia archaeon]|nr:thioredoxin family protein [Methanomicrobia archaeon]
MEKAKKTDPKTELAAIAFIALMLCSIFAGAVSAENISENPSDNTILNETERYDDFDTSNPSDNHSLTSEIDALLNTKPVFLFFYADWCHFCQQQKSIIDELEQEYADKIAFIRVNAEENSQAVDEFGVTGFPAMFLIVNKDEEGYVYQEFEGFTQKEALEESFDFVVENGGLPEDFEYSSLQFNQKDLGNSCYTLLAKTPCPTPSPSSSAYK